MSLGDGESREQELRAALIWGVAGVLLSVGLVIAVLIPAQYCYEVGLSFRRVCSTQSFVGLIGHSTANMDMRWIQRALAGVTGIVAAAFWILIWTKAYRPAG
jgi:hypothetical protein